MKQSRKRIALTSVLAFLTFAAGSLQAQVQNVLTITATLLVQGTNNDSGTVTTTKAPVKLTVGTKQILADLALAETEEGNYNSTTFPTGAELVVVISSSSFDFQVVEKNGTLLVDVSDILTGSMTGNYGSVVASGKQNDNTGLASPTGTSQEIFTLTYDDTGAGGSLQCYLTGLLTATITDTIPNSAGNYTETQSYTMTAAAGDGSYQGNPMVITGSVTAKGSGALSQ